MTLQFHTLDFSDTATQAAFLKSLRDLGDL